MKKLICGLFLMLTAAHAQAETMKFQVDSLQGQLLIENDLKVERIELVGENQFCNVWGTTCAGGPSDDKTVPADAEIVDAQTINFVTDELSVTSVHLGNRFSSCKLYVLVHATDLKSGKSRVGNGNVLWVNNKKICSNKKKVTRLAQENLDKGLTVSRATWGEDVLKVSVNE